MCLLSIFSIIHGVITVITVSLSGRTLPFMPSAFILIILVLGIGVFLTYFSNINVPSVLLPYWRRHGAVSKASLNAMGYSSSARVITALGGVVLPRKRLFFKVNWAPHTHELSGQNSSMEVQKKLILFYNRPEWIPSNNEYLFGRCAHHACTVTDNRDLVHRADAVVVLVCRIGDSRPLVARSSGQIWIAFGLESPVHYGGHHDSPAWRSMFNWTMTYRTDSDIFYPYGFLVFRSRPPLKNYTEIAFNKTKPVAWFVSNCNTQSRRLQYIQQLQKYIDVDVYGGCGKLHCPRSNENDCLRLLNSTYYFYLSFENSLCRDYVTEKFFKVFNNVNVIPVVRGGADYEQYFPPNTFINTADYDSPQHMATHLKNLMADTETYAAMMKAKDNFILSGYPAEPFCELCKKLHDTEIQQKVYPDFMNWTKNGKCWEPADV